MQPLIKEALSILTMLITLGLISIAVLIAVRIFMRK